MENKYCNKSIKNIFNNIKIEEIEKFIDEVNSMSEIRKEFYKKLIRKRYGIIKEVYDKI